VLYAIPRAESRVRLGLSDTVPFTGVDIWNAWDLTWLGSNGRPAVATAEITVPADSTNIVESKSLKLYLNSFAMSTYSSPAEVADTIAEDLSACVGMETRVRVMSVADSEARTVSRLAGTCLDTLDVECRTWQVDPGLLRADADTIVAEDLHSHLLRSLCPVTSQPDIGSLHISYRGPKIDRAALLRYVVSYRQHNDFHEACVEKIFVDLSARCAPEALSVHARYQRRGGLDINPFRSSDPHERPMNLRLWRQ
jgi:7-cyano-7-deazaguanine reductase